MKNAAALFAKCELRTPLMAFFTYCLTGCSQANCEKHCGANSAANTKNKIMTKNCKQIEKNDKICIQHKLGHISSQHCGWVCKFWWGQGCHTWTLHWILQE